jgi:hypothetical protein
MSAHAFSYEWHHLPDEIETRLREGSVEEELRRYRHPGCQPSHKTKTHVFLLDGPAGALVADIVKLSHTSQQISSGSLGGDDHLREGTLVLVAVIVVRGQVDLSGGTVVLGVLDAFDRVLPERGEL